MSGSRNRMRRWAVPRISQDPRIRPRRGHRAGCAAGAQRAKTGRAGVRFAQGSQIRRAAQGTGGNPVRLARPGTHRTANRIHRRVFALAGAVRRHGDQRAKSGKHPNPFVRLFLRLSRLWAPHLVSHHRLPELVCPECAGVDAKILRDRNYEYEVFSWVDFIASAIMRRQNFVHKALKKGEGGPIVRLAAALAALCLLPLATVLAPLSLHAGRGSTLTFVLRPIARSPAKTGL